MSFINREKNTFEIYSSHFRIPYQVLRRDPLGSPPHFASNITQISPIKCQCYSNIETSLLICTVNQLTGFAKRATLAFNGLNELIYIPHEDESILEPSSGFESGTYGSGIQHPNHWGIAQLFSQKGFIIDF